MEQLQKRHPYSFTLGPGPYSYVGFVTIAFSPTFGAKAVGDTHLGASAGTCAHCGRAIVDNYIVQTGERKVFAVGSECINKVHTEGDFSNISDFERQLRKVKREKGRATREKTRQRVLAEVTATVQANKEMLVGTQNPRGYGGSLWDYCEWYLSKHRSGTALKLFKSQLGTWGCV
jgi:hypothetical protein